MAKRRPSGDGMVRKREDGRWEGRIVIGHKANGDSIFRYIYADTQKELTAKLRQNIDIYQGIDLTEQSRMTLSEWLDLWLEQMAVTLRPSTLEHYRKDLTNHVTSYLGTKLLTQVTAMDLRKLYDTLKRNGRLNRRPGQSRGLSSNTVHGIHTTLHHALKAAKGQGLIPANPADEVDPPKVIRQPMKILNEEQLDAFMDVIRQDAIWYDFFYTELTTGLRRGEICGLMWSDFDVRSGVLKINRTLRREKGGRLVAGDTKTYAGTRKIVLPPSTAQLLGERKRKSFSPWIFNDPLRPEAPIDPDSAYRQLKKFLAEAGLPDIRFHDLRHTFSTHALASGVDAKTLAGILGHTKASFTLDTYTHTTGDMQKRAADIVGGFLTDYLGGDGSMAKRRKRGNGGVSLRKDGRWEGRVVIGYDDKGLPVTKNVLAKTKSECIAKLKALADSTKAPSPDQPRPSVLLGDWLDLWYQSYKKPNLRSNTQMSYERRIYQHIIPALGNIQMDKLTTNDIQQFYSELKKDGRLLRAELYGEGLSDQTIRGIHTTLHAALDKAVAEKLILRNPSDGCRLPSAKAREMQVLTPEEIQRLLIQAKEDDCYEFLLLELSTGLRRGEICALQWNDLNLRTGELRIERQVHRVKGELVVSPPKTKASNRSVILPAPVLKVIKAYKKTIASRWMFPSPVNEDSPRDPAAVRKRLQIVLERAECKKIRFHDLRHTFSTVSLEHGMDIKTLSTIIGHVSSSTTLNVYAHVTDEMRRTAAVKIDQGIGRAEPQEEAVTAPQKPAPSTFQAHKGQRRKPGTGCVSQINERLWEGRYSPIWPDGKKHARNVYAHSEEECETLLAEMISEMKAEISAEKERIKTAPKAS